MSWPLTPPVLMMVTPLGPKLAERVAAACAGGVGQVQLRDKAARRDDLRAAARELAALAPLVINGEAELAGELGVGVHWPEGAWRVASVSLQGCSVHSVDAARAAVDWGADYLVAGTVFASASHPGEPAAGLAFLAQVCAAVRVPVLAIGGVTPANLADCLRAGAAGVAVLSPLQGADPRAVAAAYVAALRGGGQA
jgi:thiamine-phosphate diphosphorylase